MPLPHRLAVKLTFAVLLLSCQTVLAGAYNVNAPAYPVTYTETQQAAQLTAGKAVIAQVRAALKAGAHSFTVPPGVNPLPFSWRRDYNEAARPGGVCPCVNSGSPGERTPTYEAVS